MAQHAAPPPPARHTSCVVEFVTTLDMRRATLGADSLLLEARGGLSTAYQPLRELFWDEVDLVYTWRAPDWDGMALLLLLLAAACAAALLVLGGNHFEAVLAAAFPGCVVIAWVCGIVLPQVWYRVTAGGRSITFATRRREVRTELLARVGAPAP
jgi:hypothetical protein